MTDQPSPAPQYPPPPPPQTMAGPVRRASTWPTVIGIIFMVLGALGAIGAVFEFLGPLIMGMVGDMVPDDELAGMMEPMAARSGQLYLRGALLLIVAILLIVAGIGVVSRKRWGVHLALVWAVLKLFVVAFDAWLDMMIGRDVMEAMSDMSAAPASMDVDPFLWVGMALAIAWGWLLPIFTFIWFAVPKIRAEVRTWGPADKVAPYTH